MNSAGEAFEEAVALARWSDLVIFYGFIGAVFLVCFRLGEWMAYGCEVLAW